MRRHVDITESAISNIANHAQDQDDLEAVSYHVSIEYSVDDTNMWYNTSSLWFSINRMRRHIDITDGAISNIANHAWDRYDVVSYQVSIENSNMP